MRLNNKSIQGLFLYSPTVEYEKGDFVVSGDCIYICTAIKPTNTINFTVSGRDPKYDTVNFKVYPGDKISTAQEYYDYINDVYVWQFSSNLNEILERLNINQLNRDITVISNRDSLPNPDDILNDENTSIEDRIYRIEETQEYAYLPYNEDKYISGNVLNQVLQNLFFGMSENGIVTDHVYANVDEEGNQVPEYSIGGTLLNTDTGNILDSIMRSPDLNNGMFTIDRSLLPDLQSNDTPVSNTVLLKQYTYLDKGVSNNNTVRIQEIIDPDLGCVCYRYSLGSKRNDQEYSSTQTYEIGDIIKIREQNSNREVTWIAKNSVPSGISPYDEGGEAYWKSFKGSYEYTDIEDWKIDNSTSYNLVRQLNRIKNYYDLKVRELEATREQLTGTFCNREVTNLDQQGDQTIITLVAGDNVRMHKSWEYINSDEDQVLEALGITNILDACTLFSSDSQLSAINPEALGVNLIVKVGFSNDYVYKYSINGSSNWLTAQNVNELRTAFGLTNSQKLSDIFYVESSKYNDLLEVSPDFPLTVIIKDENTGFLSIAKWVDNYDTKYGGTLFETTNVEDLVTDIYYEDLVYNNNNLGCDPTNPLNFDYIKEIGGYVGLASNDPRFHIPAPMLYCTGRTRILIKSAINLPIFNKFNDLIRDGGGGYFIEGAGSGAVDWTSHSINSGIPYNFGDIIIDRDTRKRYIAIDSSRPSSTEDYVNSPHWISITELFGECPFKAFYRKNEDRYNSSKTYNVGDVVIYNDKAFRALRTTTNNIPTDTAYWENLGYDYINNVVDFDIVDHFTRPFSHKNSIWNTLVYGPTSLQNSNNDYDNYYSKYSLDRELMEGGKLKYSTRETFMEPLSWDLTVSIDDPHNGERVKLDSLICKYYRYDGTTWQDHVFDYRNPGVTYGETQIITSIDDISNPALGDKAKISPKFNDFTTIDISSDRIINNSNGVRGFFAIIYSCMDEYSAYYAYFDLINEKIYLMSCYDERTLEPSDRNLENFLRSTFSIILNRSENSINLSYYDTYKEVLDKINGSGLDDYSLGGNIISALRSSTEYNSSDLIENEKVLFRLGYKTPRKEDSINEATYWSWTAGNLSSTINQVSLSSDEITSILNQDTYTNLDRRNVGLTTLQVSEISSSIIYKLYKLDDTTGYNNYERLNSVVYFNQLNPDFNWVRFSVSPIHSDLIDQSRFINEKIYPWNGIYALGDKVYYNNNIWRCTETQTSPEEPSLCALSWEKVDQRVQKPGDIYKERDVFYIWTNHFIGSMNLYPERIPQGSYEYPLLVDDITDLFGYYRNHFKRLVSDGNGFYLNENLNRTGVFERVLKTNPIEEIEDRRRKQLLKLLGYSYSNYVDDVDQILLIDRILTVSSEYKSLVLGSLILQGISYVIVNEEDDLYKKIEGGVESSVNDSDLEDDIKFIRKLTSQVTVSNGPINLLTRFYTPFLVYRWYYNTSFDSSISTDTDFRLGYTNNSQVIDDPDVVNNGWISGTGSLLQLLLNRLSGDDETVKHSILEYIETINASELIEGLPTLPIRVVCKIIDNIYTEEQEHYYLNGNFWLCTNNFSDISNGGYSPLSLEIDDPNELPDAFSLGKVYKQIGSYWWYVYQNPGWFEIVLNDSGKLKILQGNTETWKPPTWRPNDGYISEEEALYNLLHTNYYTNSLGEAKGIMYDEDYSYKIGDLVIFTEEPESGRYIQRMWRCINDNLGELPEEGSNYWMFYDDPLYHTFTRLPSRVTLQTQCNPSTMLRVITKVGINNTYDYFLALNTDSSDFRTSCVATILVQTDNYISGNNDPIKRTYTLTLDLNETGTYYITSGLTLTVEAGLGELEDSTRILTLNDPSYIIKNIYYRYKI